MGRRLNAMLDPAAIATYVRRAMDPEATHIEVRSLSGNDLDDYKAFGYGEPILVRYSVDDVARALVIHTMSADQFGHDRRADRVAAMLGAYDIFDSPAHVRAVDVGFIERGELTSGGRGEPFLVTEFSVGELYAHDLHVLANEERPSARDEARLQALVSYIAAMRQRRGTKEQYRRALRDIVGGGEGIFGLRDAYTDDDPIATPGRLARFVSLACAARERLRAFEHRACATHGDLHPYNVLFDGDTLRLLDRSRGGFGDTADDVTCMAINYLAIALHRRGSFSGALRTLWTELWSRVIAATGDAEMLRVVPVYFAWRTLVLASPVWYPDTSAAARESLLRFAERLLAGEPFDPERIDELVR